MRNAAIVFALATVLPVGAAAACDAPEYRQFDFWLGDWDVVAPPDAPDAGTLKGRNTIERVADGCALAEHWRGASGLDGRSLNGWDAVHGVWRQFWIGGDGVVLQLAGGLRDGSMVMSGTLPGRDGAQQQQRIRWTPNPDGSVEQRWDTSDDDGATWNASFVGLYRKSEAAP